MLEYLLASYLTWIMNIPPSHIWLILKRLLKFNIIEDTYRRNPDDNECCLKDEAVLEWLCIIEHDGAYNELWAYNSGCLYNKFLF